MLLLELPKFRDGNIIDLELSQQLGKVGQIVFFSLLHLNYRIENITTDSQSTLVRSKSTDPLFYCIFIINHIYVIMIPQIPDDPAVVEPIFQRLRANFYKGTTRPVSFRKNALRRMIDGYVSLKEEIAKALEKDLGTNAFFSDFIVHPLTIEQMEDMYNNVASWAKPESVQTPLVTGLGSCQVEPEPYGVALVISAWNYPIYTAIPQAATAIAAGNCVILKPSELAPHTSGVIKKLFDNYLDPDYYQCIQGKVEVAKAVTKLPLDVICFTGSTTTGRLVAMEAAKNLVPCVLQLGGKCPAIVDQTAALDAALNRILVGKFLNCGQTCVGVDHVYIHGSHKAKFRELLLQKLDHFYGGNQDLQNEGNYGKIVNKFHLERIEKLLTDKHGGQIIYGGTIKKQTRFMTPTVIEEPRKDSLMMKEEIFGPLLPVFYYNNLQELVKEITSRPKPLAVYHFTQSSKNIKFVKKTTYSGAYVTNDAVLHMTNLHMPFGGVGGSGYGRMHGIYGFKAMSNPKSIALLSSLDTFPTNKRYPPYTEDRKNFLRKLMKIAFVTYTKIGKSLGVTLLLIVVITLGIIFFRRA